MLASVGVTEGALRSHARGIDGFCKWCDKEVVCMDTAFSDGMISTITF